MNDYQKFKKLLEYFVAHLEYVQTNIPDGRGYSEYIKPWIEKDNFHKTGQGYAGHTIQQQVNEWEMLGEDKVCINVANHPNKAWKYKSKLCYINWQNTAFNVNAVWEGDRIASLVLCEQKSNNGDDKFKIYETKEFLKETCDALGLFDGKAQNEVLKNFYASFREQYSNWKHKKTNGLLKTDVSKTEEGQIKHSLPLLKANRNIIFHGAPGTGKTYLAKQIAARMIFGDDVPENFEQTEQFKTQCGFVQFHPSYDYTDFVEGLRPCRDDGSDNAVNGFERCDGIFKEFCKNAIQNILDSKKTDHELKKEVNAEELLDAFLEDAMVNERTLHTKTNTEFTISDSNVKGKIWISIPKIATNRLSINRNTMLMVLNHDKQVNSVRDVWKNILHRKTAAHEDSYIFAIYTEIMKPKFAKQLELNFNDSVANISRISKKNFIFIIDEINRGEVSKILGELFFSIDPGYRGEKGRVKTQYQNLVEDTDVFKDGFYVPENVYIIGTMNDIDRSVESMDFAFRRRFAWKEIKAGDSKDMLDSLDSDGVPKEIIVRAKAKMDALNAAIAKHKELNESYQIGAAYFKRIKDYVGDDVSAEDYDDAFAKLWEYHLQGLLTEYLRGIEDGTSVEMFRKVYDEAGEQSGSKEAGSASGGSEAPAES